MRGAAVTGEPADILPARELEKGPELEPHSVMSQAGTIALQETQLVKSQI
jgi:hypothetical protein